MGEETTEIINAMDWGLFRQQLIDYVRIELAGESADQVYPEVAFHIDTSYECSIAYYNELYRQEANQSIADLQSLDSNKAKQTLSKRIQDVLEFSGKMIESIEPMARFSIWESSLTSVMQLFTKLTVIINEQKAEFHQLSSLLLVQQFEIATRGEKKVAQTLALPSPEDNLSIKLTIEPVASHQTTLIVQVTYISSGEPLNRFRVTIRDEANRIVMSELAQVDGNVTFRSIEIGDYLLEIKQQDKIWRLPITFLPLENT